MDEAEDIYRAEVSPDLDTEPLYTLKQQYD